MMEGGAESLARAKMKGEGASETDDTDFGDDGGDARGGRRRGPCLTVRWGDLLRH